MGLIQTPPAVVASTLAVWPVSFMLKLPVLWFASCVIVPTSSFQPQITVTGRGLQGGPCSKLEFGRLGTVTAPATPITVPAAMATEPRAARNDDRAIAVRL
jgi:hypothetical protein